VPANVHYRSDDQFPTLIVVVICMFAYKCVAFSLTYMDSLMRFSLSKEFGRSLMVAGIVALSSPAIADVPDDTYLHCAPYLIAIEIPWKMSMDNALHDQSHIMAGVVHMTAGKAIGFPEVDSRGDAYPDRISFNNFEDYTIDRVKMRLKYTNKMDEIRAMREDRDRSSIPKYSYSACFKISKSEMKAKIEAHNEKLGGVKF